MDCCFFAAASFCGVACLCVTLPLYDRFLALTDPRSFPFFTRGDIRRKFSLKGDVLGDCLRSCCCMCCSLIQNEKEVVYQSLQNPKQGYKPAEGMYAGQ
jgi:Cys-rich protein (TIGR01571 family)